VNDQRVTRTKWYANVCPPNVSGIMSLSASTTEPSFRTPRNRTLARVLDAGRRHGTLRFHGSARSVARTLVGGLEGAMLVARPYGDVKRFRSAAALLIDGLAVD